MGGAVNVGLCKFYVMIVCLNCLFGSPTHNSESNIAVGKNIFVEFIYMKWLVISFQYNLKLKLYNVALLIMQFLNKDPGNKKPTSPILSCNHCSIS